MGLCSSCGCEGPVRYDDISIPNYTQKMISLLLVFFRKIEDLSVNGSK